MNTVKIVTMCQVGIINNLSKTELLVLDCFISNMFHKKPGAKSVDYVMLFGSYKFAPSIINQYKGVCCEVPL